MYARGPMTKPAAYAVFVTVSPYPGCGFTEPFHARVGAARTIEEARKRIADDRKAMGDTFGGLIDPVSTRGRKYQIFKATWEEVK